MLTWPSMQQLLIKPDFIPGKVEIGEFEKLNEACDNFRQCFLCGGLDAIEDLKYFNICGSLKGYAHEEEMNESVKHSCSFSVAR